MKKSLRSHVIFYLNGERHEVTGSATAMMLADYLRYEKSLTGTKIVCAEGDCGACSVLRRFPNADKKYQAINSCIATVAQMDGSSLITVDALKKQDQLSPVQEAMMKCHGSQCGFCTPGFVVALTDLVEKKIYHEKSKKITAQEAKNATTGNLCRCTGYKPIIEAAESINLKSCESVEERYYSSAQEKELKKAFTQSLLVETENFCFYAPTTLAEASKFLLKNPEAKIIAAGTDLGVMHNKWKKRYSSLLSLHLISDLYALKVTKAKVTVGARVTLSELRYGLKNEIPEFAKYLDIFASPQIKNIATLIGNIANASPIGDTPAFLLAMDAEVEISSGSKKRMVPLDRFYKGYRSIDLKKGEIITSIQFPIPKDSQSLSLYKSSQRKDLDISIVNLGMSLMTDKKTSKIAHIRIAIGGVAATPLRLRKTEEVLEGKVITAGLIKEAALVLQKEITPISDLRSGSEYRRVVAENFFLKYFRDRGLVKASEFTSSYFTEVAP